MLKDNIMANENIKPNSNEIEKLKANFPQFFDKDGEFLLDRFKKILRQSDITLNKEGYELNFLGKSYARYLSSTKTETFLAPHVEENLKEKNIQKYLWRIKRHCNNIESNTDYHDRKIELLHLKESI